AVRYLDQIRADSNLPRKRHQIRIDIMKFQTLFFGILLVGLVSVEFSHGINIFGRKKKTTTTTTENILSSGPSTTGQPMVPSNSNPQTCWWTQCSKRCPGTAQVAGASVCEGGKRVYKFNCCNAK
ncbi:unnamed protein product, partial [Allacma fusca]